MAKLTELPALATADTADAVYIVDTSDISEDPAGTSKQIAVSGLLGSPTIITALVKIEAITRVGDAPQFDFTAIATEYSRLIIRGELESADAGTGDPIDLLYNGVASETGMNNQRLIGNNDAGEFTEAADSAQVANAKSQGAAADMGPIPVEIVVLNPQDAINPKIAFGFFSFKRQAAQIQAGYIFNHSAEVNAVTQLTVKSGTDSNLTGTLTLYGEKEVTIYAK